MDKTSESELYPLLDQAKNGDSFAETELLNRYTPTMVGYVEKYQNQIPGYDANDLFQELYIPFKNAISSWDPDKSGSGGFAGLLHQYLNTHLFNLVKATETKKRGGPGSGPDRDDLSATLEDESLADEVVRVLKGDPDPSSSYAVLVDEVESLIPNPLAKQIFRMLIEMEEGPHRIRTIREELHLSPASVSNYLARQIYPAVTQAVADSTFESLRDPSGYLPKNKVKDVKPTA